MQYSFDIVDIHEDFKSKYKIKRDCINQIMNYLNADFVDDKICAIYGLRRTGKTVLMEQSIELLSSEDKKKARFLICNKNTIFYELVEYIEQEVKNGAHYFFIDEITYADGFQKIGEILANKYVRVNDARIVVTGTDSLGLSLPTHNIQYKRTFLIHTTYITYAEYVKLMGKLSLDEYIQKGSVLEPDIFSDYYSTHDYIDTSITDNLINSLEKSEGIERYPAVLTEIYEKDELKNLIERIINKFSQDISVKAIRKQFESGIITTAIHNIAKNKEEPDNIQVVLDYKKLNDVIADCLGIKKNEEMTINVEKEHQEAVYEFLKEMDVLTSIPVLKSYDGERGRNLEMITHPGICHANMFYSLSCLMDNRMWLANATEEQKNRLIQSAYNSACGSLMENIIIADMYYMLCGGNEVLKEDFPGNTTGRWYVSKLNCSINNKNYEADVIVFDKYKKETYLFEIKHSIENVPEQSIHIESSSFIDYVEENFGTLKARAVLYNGVTDGSSVVPRISAGDFLLQLYKDIRQNEFSLDDTMKKICANIGSKSPKIERPSVLAAIQECKRDIQEQGINQSQVRDNSNIKF